MKIVILLAIFLIILISGCTQSEVQVNDFTEDNTENPTGTGISDSETNSIELETDPCENVVCELSTETCPDGEEMECENICSEGECSTCVPSCEGHEKTSVQIFTQCDNVVCKSTIVICPDGTEMICPNVCKKRIGECTECEPDCTGHEDVQGGEICENWNCGDWSNCIDGIQSRACTDRNECGTTEHIPDETQDCTPQPRIINILYDPPGESTEEIVEIEGNSIDMSGWTLEDDTGKTYTFPQGFTIQNKVNVHTDHGVDTATDLYWDRGSAVWNNGGDTATLKDNEENIVDEYSY